MDFHTRCRFLFPDFLHFFKDDPVTKGADGNEGKILEAQLAVDGESGKYPEFRGNVATVYTHPLSQGGASNSHYNGNAETYMNVGEAMGRAMAELLKAEGE